MKKSNRHFSFSYKHFFHYYTHSEIVQIRMVADKWSD